MSTEVSESDDPFGHVHVCVHCGAAYRREMFGDETQTTGIYPCQKCGMEGPLNIEIRAVDTPPKDGLPVRAQ